jgi:hypothetical protein
LVVSWFKSAEFPTTLPCPFGIEHVSDRFLTTSATRPHDHAITRSRDQQNCCGNAAFGVCVIWIPTLRFEHARGPQGRPHGPQGELGRAATWSTGGTRKGGNVVHRGAQKDGNVDQHGVKARAQRKAWVKIRFEAPTRTSVHVGMCARGHAWSTQRARNMSEGGGCESPLIRVSAPTVLSFRPELAVHRAISSSDLQPPPAISSSAFYNAFLSFYQYIHL